MENGHNAQDPGDAEPEIPLPPDDFEEDPSDAEDPAAPPFTGEDVEDVGKWPARD